MPYLLLFHLLSYIAIMHQLRPKELKQLRREASKRPQEIVLLLDNFQYARNVAAMFRIADAAGVERLVLAGNTAQPPFGKELQQVSRHKEKSVRYQYQDNAAAAAKNLKDAGFFMIGIELTDESVDISQLPRLTRGHNKICFVAGNEVHGVSNKILEICDASVHIPMYGQGASLNVTQATTVVLYSF